MSKLAEWFVEAGRQCGLAVEKDFTLRLGDGRKLISIVRIPRLGDENGMLVFTDFDLRYMDELTSLGYGFSTLSEPGFNEEFDLESFEEMFADWGWSGKRA